MRLRARRAPASRCVYRAPVNPSMRWMPTCTRTSALTAEKMLRFPKLGPVENHARNVLRPAEEYRVDGAIHFSHRGCRQSCEGVRVLKYSLMKLGVPLLNLNGDEVDSRTYSPGPEKTRVEGFLETPGE